MAKIDGTISYGGVKVLIKDTDLEKRTFRTDGNMLMAAVNGYSSDPLRASVPSEELKNKKFVLEHGDEKYIVNIGSIEFDKENHLVKFAVAYNPQAVCDTGG